MSRSLWSVLIKRYKRLVQVLHGTFYHLYSNWWDAAAILMSPVFCMVSPAPVIDTCSNYDVIIKDVITLGCRHKSYRTRKHNTTITNWPKGANESSTVLRTACLHDRCEGDIIKVFEKREISPSGCFHVWTVWPFILEERFIIYSAPWLRLERWETHKQGVCCYLAHRNKTQPTPPSSSCFGG